MMLLNTLLDELTGRGSGTEAERHERYNWLEQLRCTNPQADENGPMAGIPSYHWFRLPQCLCFPHILNLKLYYLLTI